MAGRPNDQSAGRALTLRPATDNDRDTIWKIFQATVAPGDAFVHAPNISREEAMGYWFAPGTDTFVAEQGGQVIGSYILRPNQPGLGNHIANAGFMVDRGARGLGVGRAMGEHCLSEARRCGYRGMQFNFVISTNESAVRLWQQLGFTIVATLPGAFRHAQKGFVDAYVMFRSLEDS
jgi:ribosomal protein S18 acetylase RimI-like enzyme